MSKSKVLVVGGGEYPHLMQALEESGFDHVMTIDLDQVMDATHDRDRIAVAAVDRWRSDDRLLLMAIRDGAAPAGKLLTMLQRPADSLVVCAPELSGRYEKDEQIGYITYSGNALLIADGAIDLELNPAYFTISQCLQYQASSASIIIDTLDMQEEFPLLENPSSLKKIVNVMAKIS